MLEHLPNLCEAIFNLKSPSQTVPVPKSLQIVLKFCSVITWANDFFGEALPLEAL